MSEALIISWLGFRKRARAHTTLSPSPSILYLPLTRAHFHVAPGIRPCAAAPGHVTLSSFALLYCFVSPPRTKSSLRCTVAFSCHRDPGAQTPVRRAEAEIAERRRQSQGELAVSRSIARSVPRRTIESIFIQVVLSSVLCLLFHLFNCC